MDVHENVWRLIWPCNCWFCRHFSRPLLSRLLRKELAILTKLLKNRRKGRVRVRKLSESTDSRFEELRKEIAEIKGSITDLKKVLAEIKGFIADISSPYAVLATSQQEEVSAEHEKSPAKAKPKVLPRIIASRQAMKGIEKGREKMIPKPNEKHGREAEIAQSISKKTETMDLEDMRQLIGELGTALAARESEEMPVKKIDVRKVIRILKTIYSLRRTLPRESIENILKLAEILGLVTKEEKETLSTIVSLVEGGLRHNMTLEDQIIVLYILMRNLGYMDEELEEEMLRIVSDTLIAGKKAVKNIEQDSIHRPVENNS